MSAIPRSDESILLREDREGVCTLTLNRPAQMNLLTTEMLDALQEAFDAIAADKRVRVVILAATGKGFCAGHDVKEIRALKELPKIEELFGKCSRMMQTITALPQPVIARVQGVAAAAGCWGSVCCRAAPDAPNEPDAPDVTMPGSTRALMTTATVVRPADRILTPYSGRAPSGASSAYTAVWEKSPNE